MKFRNKILKYSPCVFDHHCAFSVLMVNRELEKYRSNRNNILASKYKFIVNRRMHALTVYALS